MNKQQRCVFIGKVRQALQRNCCKHMMLGNIAGNSIEADQADEGTVAGKGLIQSKQSEIAIQAPVDYTVREFQ